MEKNFLKRKTKIIDKSFQYRLIATFLISVLIALVVFTIFAGVYFWVISMAGENLFDNWYVKVQSEVIARPGDVVYELGDTVYEEKPTVDEVRDQFVERYLEDSDEVIYVFNDSRAFYSEIPSDQELTRMINAAKIDVTEKKTRRVQGTSAYKLWNIAFQPIVINNILIMIVIVLIGIGYSHSIAGPIYRMNQDIDKVLSGDSSVRIRLRKTDKFHELAEQINQLIDEYNKRS